MCETVNEAYRAPDTAPDVHLRHANKEKITRHAHAGRCTRTHTMTNPHLVAKLFLERSVGGPETFAGGQFDGDEGVGTHRPALLQHLAEEQRESRLHSVFTGGQFSAGYNR